MKRTTQWVALVGTMLMLSMGCGDAAAPDENLPPVGKGDFTGNGKLSITGDRNETISIDPAFQCDLGQFQSLGSWHNKDLGSDFMTLRMYVLHDYWRPVEVGDSYAMLGTKGRIAFDGAGYNSEYGDGCDVTVSAFQNDGQGANAGIQFTTTDCMLRVTADREVFLAGTFGCTGAGWDPIIVDGPADTTTGDTSVGDTDMDGDIDDGDTVGGDDTTSTEDTTAPEDTVVPDPCAGACTASEACVFGTCVTRSTQTQSSQCYNPTKPCDDGDNGDCADNHACVEGKCRRLSCQTQSSQCYNPTSPCDGDENTDCADNHACVEGKCRRLSCQTQSSQCYNPTSPCDGDDNSDCADNHACVDGKCRRLSCQTQSSQCYNPTAPCDADDADCADNHVCNDAQVCERVSCQ